MAFPFYAKMLRKDKEHGGRSRGFVMVESRRRLICHVMAGKKKTRGWGANVKQPKKQIEIANWPLDFCLFYFVLFHFYMACILGGVVGQL